MKLSEWDLEFDILYNNISSNQSPGHTALEKSIILTQAQEIYFKELYSGTATGASFEKTEEITEYLRRHVKQTSLDEISEEYPGEKICSKSHLFSIPADLWYITYESATLVNADCEDREALVVPVKQDDFYKTYNNPFRGPDKRRVLRLEHSDYIELVSDGAIQSYNVRYIKKPNPIVLPNLTSAQLKYYTDNGIKITNADGTESDVTTSGYNCELPESTHRTILIKAVQIAKSIWA